MPNARDRYGRDVKTEKRGEPEGGPAKRMKWFRSSRSDAQGKSLAGIRAKAARRRRMIAKGFDKNVPGTPGGPGSVNWTPIGPSVVSRGWTESGRVMAIGQEGNFATKRDVRRGRQDIRTFYVKVQVLQAEGELKPGMTAEVSFARHQDGTRLSSNSDQRPL